MYVFSVNASAKEAVDGIAQGQSVPFIVYINAPKLEGAEKLCTLQLLRAGFHQVDIKKHKKIAKKALADKKIVAAHAGLSEALEKGFSIHIFDED
jgi:hypothetical protein|tara:strand:+ start:400 stop:684 length:285 start_codon:yes stop_codon:yes gene_type:complete